jgi:hypothetical protein
LRNSSLAVCCISSGYFMVRSSSVFIRLCIAKQFVHGQAVCAAHYTHIFKRDHAFRLVLYFLQFNIVTGVPACIFSISSSTAFSAVSMSRLLPVCLLWQPAPVGTSKMIAIQVGEQLFFFYQRLDTCGMNRRRPKFLWQIRYIITFIKPRIHMPCFDEAHPAAHWPALPVAAFVWRGSCR